MMVGRIKHWLWMAAALIAALWMIYRWRRADNAETVERVLAGGYLHEATLESARAAKQAREFADMHALRAAKARDDAARQIEKLKLGGATKLAALVARWNGEKP